MASNHTTNIHLSQWEENDEVLRADFNADNAKIDAALSAAEQNLQTAQAQSAAAVQTLEGKIQTAQAQTAAALRRTVGVYVGTGSEKQQQITLGYQPAAVFVVTDGGLFNTYSLGTNYHAELAVPGGVQNYVTINAAGFTITGNLNTTNNNYLTTYHYIAWK